MTPGRRASSRTFGLCPFNDRVDRASLAVGGPALINNLNREEGIPEQLSGVVF